jgi:chemotaxis protein methyltransferase CheR
MVFMLTNDQWERMHRLAMELAGIELFDRHRELMQTRARRMGVGDAASMEAFLAAAADPDSPASRRFVEMITTKFTGFFRHPRHFDVAARHAQGAAQLRGRVKIWSAGAATGEEPYSLAMAMIEAFGRDDPPVTILATDINREILSSAAQGDYSEASLEGLDARHRERYFQAQAWRDHWRIAENVRRLVEFRELNLVAPDWPIHGPFDIIFCRNVLMYLAADIRLSVLGRIASLLASDGILVMDPVEHPGKGETLFTSGSNGVFLLRPASGSAKDPQKSPVISDGKATL